MLSYGLQKITSEWQNHVHGLHFTLIDILDISNFTCQLAVIRALVDCLLNICSHFILMDILLTVK